MRYFDEDLITNSRPHGDWWNQLGVSRDYFHHVEDHFATFQGNASAVLPRDAWLELDTITTRVMRDDGGQPFMGDLMALAKPVNIGTMAHLSRVASDTSNPVQRSLSGQVPVAMDKTVYDYRGTVVPIFADGYGREWREWNTLRAANFDALADDQEGALDKINRDMADYALDGDAAIKFQGYTAYGLRNSPLTKLINLGSGSGGANIDLTTATSDALEAFFIGPFGAMLDANLITESVNLYISPAIARAWDKSYSNAAGFKEGTIREFVERNRRINKIEVTAKLTGNQFFGFVPNARYVRPLVGMAVNTTAMTRLNPTDNYQFLVMGAMGIEVRGDYAGKSGVFASTIVN